MQTFQAPEVTPAHPPHLLTLQSIVPTRATAPEILAFLVLDTQPPHTHTMSLPIAMVTVKRARVAYEEEGTRYLEIAITPWWLIRSPRRRSSTSWSMNCSTRWVSRTARGPQHRLGGGVLRRRAQERAAAARDVARGEPLPVGERDVAGRDGGRHARGRGRHRGRHARPGNEGYVRTARVHGHALLERSGLGRRRPSLFGSRGVTREDRVHGPERREREHLRARGRGVREERAWLGMERKGPRDGDGRLLRSQLRRHGRGFRETRPLPAPEAHGEILGRHGEGEPLAHIFGRQGGFHLEVHTHHCRSLRSSSKILRCPRKHTITEKTLLR